MCTIFVQKIYAFQKSGYPKSQTKTRMVNEISVWQLPVRLHYKQDMSRLSETRSEQVWVCPVQNRRVFCVHVRFRKKIRSLNFGYPTSRMRIIRVIRVIRVSRVVRVIRVIRDIREMRDIRLGLLWLLGFLG